MSNKPNFGKRRKLDGVATRSLMDLASDMASGPQHVVVNFAHLAQGYEIDGGCEHCDAFQTVEPDPKHSNVSHLHIHHDDDCPVLARHRGKA